MVGYLQRHAVEPKLWPYLLFGWAYLAAIAPWLIRSDLEEEFRPGYSLMLGVISALPFSLAARWLADGPYRALSIGCWAVVALWGVHFLVSIIRSRKPAAGGE